MQFVLRIMISLLFISLLARPGVAQAKSGVHPEEIHIEITQLEQGEWRVAYHLARSVGELDLGPALNGFRQSDWRVITENVTLINHGGRDYLQAGGGRFDTVAIRIKGRTFGFVKQYEPIRSFGKNGAVIYTGHFWPWHQRGGRMRAVFSFKPTQGGRISVYRWRGVFDHPAFVYFGPIKSRETKSLVAVADPGAPRWIIREFHASAPKIFDHLRTAFRSDLGVKPNVFLSFEPGGPEGLLRYSGDALPGQFQLALHGGSWWRQSLKAKDLIRHGVAHEAVHLWQSATANPFDRSVPDWIHEGAADAIAAETLVALGFWTSSDAERNFANARTECAYELTGTSLAQAAQGGSVRALYACGHILMRVAAEAHNGAGSVTAFWRAFMRRASEAGGYDAALFYQTAADAGGRDLADALRWFATKPLANPKKEITQLLAQAKTQSAP